MDAISANLRKVQKPVRKDSLLGSDGNELEPINYLFAFLNTAFDAKSEHRPKTPLQIFTRQPIRRMTLQSRIRHPSHAIMISQPLRKSHGVGRLTLAA